MTMRKFDERSHFILPCCQSSSGTYEFLRKRGFSVERIHGNRSQAQRTQTLAAFKDGSLRVLVATDIVARGIDVEALGHVINYDVPNVPDDYIHRVGRTARAELTGEAYTFVSPDEEQDARRIERAIGKSVERLKVAGFDYTRRNTEVLEIPLKDRIAAIRVRKAEERVRSKAKAEARERRQAEDTEHQRVRDAMTPAFGGRGRSPQRGRGRPQTAAPASTADAPITDEIRQPTHIDNRPVLLRHEGGRAVTTGLRPAGTEFRRTGLGPRRGSASRGRRS